MMPVTAVSAKRLIPGRYRQLAVHREFSRLLPALAVCDLGDGMSVVAVAWLAVRISAPATSGSSGLLVGAAVAAYVLPGAVGALVFGRWLRAVPARRLITADAWLRAVFLGCIPIAWLCGMLNPAVYVVLLAGSSLLCAWGGAGRYALVVDLIPADERPAANALISTSTWVATILGPTLAGVLAWVIGPAWIIGVDALSFVVLALQVRRLTGSTLTHTPTPSATPTSAPTPAIRVLLRDRDLLGLLAMTWCFNFCYGPVEAALPLFVVDDLHAGAGLLGLYWTVFGVGAVIGALYAGKVRSRSQWPILILIVASHGLFMLPFGLAVPAAVTLVGFSLAGLVYGPYSALSFNLLQDRTPAALLTTVLAARAAILLTATPTGAVLGGPLSAAFGPRRVLAGTGIAMLVLALTAAGAAIRRLRTPPDSAPATQTADFPPRSASRPRPANRAL